MKPESNRKRSPKRSPALRDATLAQLADIFPEGTVIGDGSLKDYRDWARGDGPGRPYAIDPTDFPRLRAGVIADLCAEGEKPTRQRIAERLHVDVRTLYAYDHEAARGPSKVGISITGPGFKMLLGPSYALARSRSPLDADPVGIEASPAPDGRADGG